MEEIKGLLYNIASSSFIGVSMQQCWADLAIWEQFLKKHEIGSLIELGTGACGMALFFKLQSIQRGFQFATFDISPGSGDRMRSHPILTAAKLDLHFHLIDVFDEVEYVQEYIKWYEKPLMLFCDDGDKPREFRTFVPFLESGDYVATHDWGAEIKEEDVEGFSIDPVMKEECETWHSFTRFWRIQ